MGIGASASWTFSAQGGSRRASDASMAGAVEVEGTEARGRDLLFCMTDLICMNQIRSVQPLHHRMADVARRLMDCIERHERTGKMDERQGGDVWRGMRERRE